MRNKAFIVTHAKARAPLTIKGKDLDDALEKEGLDPAIWKPVGEAQEIEEESIGNNQGDAGPEDN